VFAMRLTKWLTFVITVCLGVFAFGQDVHYNYDRGANFSAYKTYQWVDAPSQARTSGSSEGARRAPEPPPGLPKINIPDTFTSVTDDQLLTQDIQRAVDGQLAAKGLRRVDKDADMLITYHAAVREEKSASAFGSGWGGRGYGGMWDGSISGQTSTIPVGAIVIDMYDAGKKQLIWRGDASKTMDLSKNPDKNYKNLEKAIAKLFKNYPPQHK